MIPKGFKEKKSSKADELYYDNPIHIAEMACEGYDYLWPSDMLGDAVDRRRKARSSDFKRGLDRIRP